MADDDTQDENQSSKPVLAERNPLLTILVLLNTIVTGTLGFLFYQNYKEVASLSNVSDIVEAEMRELSLEKQSGETGEGEQVDGILFPLEGFTANLAQSDGPRRFVRLSAVLKFNRDSNVEEFSSRKPQIRDAIISTLNSKRPGDLLKLEGKNYLKEEIKAAINSFLVDGAVIDVYYVSFQIN